MSKDKFIVLSPILVSIVIAFYCAALVRPTASVGVQDDIHDDWRQVRAREQRLTMMLPYDWRLTINERVAGFLSATSIDESGQTRPTHFNVRYASREDGADYPLPDPDAYAAVYLAGVRTNDNMEGIELVEAATVELAGLTGTLVEFTFTVNGVESRARSYNLIATDPPRRYIVTYGTIESLWDQETAIFDTMIDSILIE